MTVTRIASWSGRVTNETVTLPLSAQPQDVVLVYASRVSGGWNSESVHLTGYVGHGMVDDWLPTFAAYSVEEPTESLAVAAPAADAVVAVVQYRGFPPYPFGYIDAAGHFGTSGGSYPPAGRIPGRFVYSRSGRSLVLRSIAFDRLPTDKSLVWAGGNSMTRIAFTRVAYDDPGWSESGQSEASLDVREAAIFDDAEEQWWGITPYGPGEEPGWTSQYNVGNYTTWCVVLSDNVLEVLSADSGNPAPVGSGQFPI